MPPDACVREHLDGRRDLRRGPTIPAPEDHPAEPEAPYGMSKQRPRATASCSAVCTGSRRCRCARQRVRAAAGSARRGGRDRDLLRQAARGRPPTVFGDGKQTRDYIHVADVVRRTSRPRSRMPAAPSTSAPACETCVLDLIEELAEARRRPVRGPARARAAGRGAPDRDRRFARARGTRLGARGDGSATGSRRRSSPSALRRLRAQIPQARRRAATAAGGAALRCWHGMDRRRDRRRSRPGAARGLAARIRLAPPGQRRAGGRRRGAERTAESLRDLGDLVRRGR